MNVAYEKRELNPYVGLLEDAQTEIKLAVKNGILSGEQFSVTAEKVRKVIERVKKHIRSETLRKDAVDSLTGFATRAYKDFKAALSPFSTTVLAAALLLWKRADRKTGRVIPGTQEEKSAAERLVRSGRISWDETHKGLPLEEFHKVYMNRVENALDGLVKEKALDPNDVRGRNSLRNLAEMQVRYERHLNEIEELKRSGARLVVCSVHADCSARCAPYQGRVYSLDGTIGKTEDGRDFVPLERATDIYYTTKSGRTYKNGLLGFNCRHRLFPYRQGMEIPSVSKEEREREYGITKTQREMERKIVAAKERAEMFRGINGEEQRKNRKRAKDLYEAYKAYSLANDRAFYPERTKLL